MSTNQLKRTIAFWLIAFITTTGLPGCFKGEISVDIKQNGSGIINIAIGMTQQAKALVANQGVNPFQDMEQSLADGSGATQDVKVTTWIDGEYEWAKAEKEFRNLDEVTQMLRGRELFNKFSLIRNRGMFQDEFVLDAEFSQLNDNTSSNDYGIDPAAFIQMSFSARLPGRIIETNGLRDINDPNRIVWSMQSNQPVSITARSTAWNWGNIFIMGGCFVILGIAFIGGLVYYFNTSSAKNKNPETVQTVLKSPIQEAPATSDLGIEVLLSQINAKVLNSVGQMHKVQGEITLSWKDAKSQQRAITVKELEGNQISINGEICSATKEDVKACMIRELRKQVGK